MELPEPPTRYYALKARALRFFSVSQAYDSAESISPPLNFAILGHGQSFEVRLLPSLGSSLTINCGFAPFSTHSTNASIPW